MQTDVLIVGAGPTGLMLANQLARRGIRCRIIDRHAGPALQTRALGVQARTLEIYARLGVVERALALGRPATGANLWAEGKHLAQVPLGSAGAAISPYPYILILGQDDNERILGEHLAGLGTAIRWNTELVGLVQEVERAIVTLREPDGSTTTLEASWVAGCDGARSAVRELSGIAFEGAPYRHEFYVADCDATGTMVPDQVNVYLWQSGFHLFFPLRGSDHWRIVGIVPPDLRDAGEPNFESVLPSLRDEAGDALQIARCSWFSTYRIHHRRAAHFAVRRAFLLGDAAHVHSPVGAQGMNTGLQDACNLAWKLALVVQGHADPALLDSYAAEREPVAQRLLDTTDRAFRYIVAEGRFAGLLRTRVVARLASLAMRQEAIQRAVFRVVSQTAIHYRTSRLSVTDPGWPDGSPRAGDRFPWLRLRVTPDGPEEDFYERLDDTRFSVVVVGQHVPPDAEAAFGTGLAWLPVVDHPANTAALAAVDIPTPSYFVLRPDGHIGRCGRTLVSDVLAEYAGKTLGLRRASM